MSLDACVHAQGAWRSWTGGRHAGRRPGAEGEGAGHFGVPAEKRAERLASASPDDNRVTHGCINMAPDFYEQVIRPTFERGGVFYILPDKDSLAETFPDFAQSREAGKGDD